MIFIVFLFITGVQLIFWLLVAPQGFARVFREEEPESIGPAREVPGVSVIVCFRNEAATLYDCLTGVLAQEYPGEFEVIAVDDGSTDGSADAVTALQRAGHARLRLLRPGPTRPGKKDALTHGIGAARHDRLLLTDADCQPASVHWLRLMTAPLNDNEVVLGVSPYRPGGDWLTRFQHFEANYVALKYLGFAALGLPYMGVGRNLAYRKSFFERAGGFAGHTDVPGGDDDIIIGHHAPPDATVRVNDPDAFTFSAPTTDRAAFLRQRARHQRAGFRYRELHKMLLTLLALSHGLFYLLGLVLLFTPYAYSALAVYGVRLAAVAAAHRRAPQPKPAGSAVSRLARWAVYDAGVALMYLYVTVTGGAGRRGGW